MWNEVWIDGRWWPLDGTRADGRVSAGHLKMSDNSLSDGSEVNVLFPVLEWLGELEMEVSSTSRIETPADLRQGP
jgi:hypothetical protein